MQTSDLLIWIDKKKTECALELGRIIKSNHVKNDDKFSPINYFTAFSKDEICASEFFRYTEPTPVHLKYFH